MRAASGDAEWGQFDRQLPRRIALAVSPEVRPATGLSDCITPLLSAPMPRHPNETHTQLTPHGLA